MHFMGEPAKELTFDELHHLDVIRMCNKGPVNLKDAGTVMSASVMKAIGARLIFSAEL